jgi:uncharacterized membrane-anchored protein
MKRDNLPLPGPRYWAAMSAASVFGANMGDFVSHDLHMGHAGGLPGLALLFAAILALERWPRWRSEAFYWLAVVVLRTAATNVADLATHDLKLGSAAVAAVLALLMAGVMLADRQPAPVGLPAADARYWLALGLAGTLGTVLGDAIADGAGLGFATAATATVLSMALVARSRNAFAGKPGYWATIVAVRTAGTNVGDMLADALDLPVSTAATGIVLLVTLLAWRQRRVVLPA